MERWGRKSLLAAGGVLVMLSLSPGGTPPAEALIRGVCSDCHTMHNSQDGESMAFGAGGDRVNAMLTRGGCIGCHAQNTGEKIVTFGSNKFPQVMHTDAGGDLAAGNFAYITGDKGSGAHDSKGHNVRDVVNQDSRAGLFGPPGGAVFFFHNNGGNVNSGNLTCAGNNGCHGYRAGDGFGIGSGIIALKGAHHGNVDGLLNSALTLPGSYRFLLGVRGLENPNPDDRWQNRSSSSHNEYFGASTPGYIYPAGDCESCHSAIDGYIRPHNNTISAFCATCHGNFHTLTTGSSTGIGTDTVSPFIRHPTDIVIKNEGEYAGYTTYNITAPAGRQVLPESPSSDVTPGSDTVTCLSCHMAHASDYSSMLRFDYSQMMAHEGGDASGNGCFACHTTKDE